MHDRSLARWTLVATLGLALGGCPSPRVEPRQPDAASAERTAVRTDDAPPAVPAGPAGDEADTGAGEAPGEVATAPAVPNDVHDTGGGPPDVDPGPHCGDPPERRAARENMRRMAEAHERLGAGLAALRAELQTQALGVADSLSLDRIPAVAADLARRCAEVPDATPVGAEFLETLLREAAFWGAVCRTLEGGRTDCERLDVDGKSDDFLCRSVVRLLDLARGRPRGWRPWDAVARAFGWNWARRNEEHIARIVLRGEGEASCERLAGRDPAASWYGPACRALAAHDVSRCEALAEPSRRRTCAALVHALLGPGDAAGDRPSAAGALLREQVAPTGSGPSCADALPRIVAELLDAADVFELAPLALPRIEVERGMIAQP